ECALQFKLDAQQWARICRRSADFYARIAYIRYDPSPHLARAAQYENAVKRIQSGQFDGIGGLGIDLAALQKAATTVTAAEPPHVAILADPAAAAACRAVAAGLVSGDRAALESLAPQTRSDLMQRG